MKLTFVSTHPPRECGLATFNRSLINAINANATQDGFEMEEEIFALNADPADQYAYPPDVKYVIRQQYAEDYIEAALRINTNDTDACILQHEFGIYGGDDGIYVLSLVNHLEKPLVSIFHTVLEKPSQPQKIILQTIAKRSDKVVVMGKIAVHMLIEIYGIPREKIVYLQHGAPDLEPSEVNPVLNEELFRGRKLMLTFGLISRNKGLETVIRALPKIVKKHPDVLYVILGSTHPGILKNSGEEYRECLLQLAADLGVSDNIAFINRFVTEDELIDYLAAAEIYISPYLNEAQITSGTLAYAVGAGAAVVATPYWHAREILADGRGSLFNFKDTEGLATVVNGLLDEPLRLETIRRNAYQYGLNLRWPVIGRQYVKIIKNVIENPDLTERIMSCIIDPETMPEFSLDYIQQLTDSTGIIQHAKYGIPNRKEGYCVDDNARALIMSLMAYHQGYKESLKLMPVYMSFLHYMQNEGGNFRNFLGYNREYLDKIGSEDAFGRTIWALGCLINQAPSHAYARFGTELFQKACPHFRQLEHLRGIGNTIIGVCYYLKTCPSDKGMLDMLNYLTGVLADAFKREQRKDWDWFEDSMTYDNAILPLALFHSAEITSDDEVLEIAFKTMKFLEKITMTEKYCNPVGNKGWYQCNGKVSGYDQQAIDVMAMVLLYGQVYQMTKETAYQEKLFTAYSWFLGQNSLAVPLYDVETGGCCDGLSTRGINLNQGAESTLAYQIAHLAVLQAVKAEQKQTQEPNTRTVGNTGKNYSSAA